MTDCHNACCEDHQHEQQCSHQWPRNGWGVALDGPAYTLRTEGK